MIKKLIGWVDDVGIGMVWVGFEDDDDDGDNEFGMMEI